MAATGYTTGDPQKVDLAGDTMTGELVLPDSSPDSDLTAASRGYVTNAAVNVTGDAMTGPLTLTYNDIATDVGHDLSMALSTGIMHQDAPISQASSTQVTVPAGFATFVGPHHIHSAPVVKTVAFGPATVTITDLTDPLTYLGVDVNGNIVQIDGVPSRVQRRQYAILGRAVVIAGAITNVQDSPTLAANPLYTTLDILGSFDGLRVSGLRITPVAGTLTFDIASGGIFNLGANNANNMDDPNVSTFNAQAPAQFRYVTQNSVVDVTPRTAIDPLNYDVGGTVTLVGGGAGTTTIQRVHCFPTQNIFIQYGQNTYSTLTAAIDALAAGESGTMPFVTNPDLVGGGVRTGFILTTRVCTSLTDAANARVLRATKIGDPGGV